MKVKANTITIEVMTITGFRKKVQPAAQLSEDSYGESTVQAVLALYKTQINTGGTLNS